MAPGLKLPLMVLLLLALQVAAAEPLPDPTRPSIDLSYGTGSAGGAADIVPVESVPQGLQSIIIAPNYRAAIINGETVSLGGKLGDSRLVEVRESSVVLQNAQGRRVMELFPKVNIKKNETVQQGSAAPVKASGQTNPPEQAVGGIK
jgi:MSHA biogenesis protein MshK